MFSFYKKTQWVNFSTQMSLYEALYGQKPPIMIECIPGSTKVNEVGNTLQYRQEVVTLLKNNLHQAQNSMKEQVDQHRTQKSFKEGNMTILHLQQYKQASPKMKIKLKLAPKFYKAFKVLKKMGQVVYQFVLSASSKIILSYMFLILYRYLTRSFKHKWTSQSWMKKRT